MNKFEHFTEKEMDAICGEILHEVEESRFTDASGTSIFLMSPYRVKEIVINTINRTLDAGLVQRVIEKKVQDENKVKIGSKKRFLIRKEKC